MESFLKKKNPIILRFENKSLTVYNFKCLENVLCYKWMLKSFSFTFAREGDFFNKNLVFI